MAGTLVQVPGASVNTADMLTAFEAYQKVCVVNGTIKGIVDFASTKLVVGSAFTVAPLPGDTLTQAGTDAQMTVDTVSADKKTIYGLRITDAEFNTSGAVTVAEEGQAHERWTDKTMSPASFIPASVTEPTTPHWYAWTKHPEFTKDIPTTAYLGCLYNGRATLAGFPDAPHQWIMTRQAEIFEFDYFAGDAQTALSGHNESAGKIGDIIRSLVPWHDAFLIYGCSHSMWVLRGDPANGGQISPLDDSTGMFGAQSWCWDGDGNLWFWGSNGIYRISASGGISQPENISEDPLPRLIRDEGANPSTHRITMGYDPVRNGILVSITKLADGSNSCYWFDIRTGGFFPERYPSACGAYSMYTYPAEDPDNRGLLLGGRDGYIRIHEDTAKNDEKTSADEAIDSYVTIGPAAMGDPPGHEGTISGIQVEAGGGNADGTEADSDPLTYSIYTDLTAGGVLEKIDANIIRLARTILAPGCRRGTRNRQVVRGAFGAIQLRNNALNQSWAIEKLVLNE